MFFKIGNFLNRELTRFLADRSGATMVEYGLMIAFISVAILITFVSIGETMRDDIFTAISDAMQSGSSQASP
ncbi:Flp family type IVb pilin [Labrenzia sp. PHM005]|uniref:Flp family type IVb pilin n=1 Tax=Labrenzia sp. PHM005 TaxID=2590016 RepID=UPI00114085A8|nr:Flp family type IVb pilin [Labrenzia sp. PHM005]QDG75620.1 Flp family type IVb pilin [Labrenzia sp. PHM005]